MKHLALHYPRHCQVIELRFFAGMSVEETALVLQVSAPTVVRDWAFARAWVSSVYEGRASHHLRGEITMNPMQTHVKVLAILHIVFGALGVLIGLGIFAFFGGIAGLIHMDHDPDAAFVVPMMGMIGGFVLIVILVQSTPGSSQASAAVIPTGRAF